MYTELYVGEHKWRDCQACRLADTRRNVVLTRTERFTPVGRRPGGTNNLPRHNQREDGLSFSKPFLFIGEAPGKTEDSTGLPFMGESRRILRLILGRLDYSFDAIITNVVSCRPLEYDNWGNLDANRAPTPQEIERCSPKLMEVVNHTDYEAIIYIGKVAAGFKTKLPSYSLLHPAAIARMEYRMFTIKEQALLLNRFLKELYDKPRHLPRQANSSR